MNTNLTSCGKSLNRDVVLNRMHVVSATSSSFVDVACGDVRASNCDAATSHAPQKLTIWGSDIR